MNTLRNRFLSLAKRPWLVGACGLVLLGCAEPAGGVADGVDASLLPDSSTPPPPDASVAQPDACVPTTCGALGLECGAPDDGCGGALSCGGCDAGQVCDEGLCQDAPVDCSGIAGSPGFELCDSGPDHCAGVFTGGEGCAAFCAAAGLVCVARTGGEPGCQQEPQNVMSCNESNGHVSDWCECGAAGDPDPTCPSDPLDPPVYQDLHFSQASYHNRSAWVLLCYDYAYTAYQDEHEACDSQYQHGSAQGTATFTFTVGRGHYDVYIEGRHTANRNPSGARVTVTAGGVTYTEHIMQRDGSGAITADLHGRYCLEGQVEVVVDSTVSTASDSVRRVILEPVP